MKKTRVFYKIALSTLLIGVLFLTNTGFLTEPSKAEPIIIDEIANDSLNISLQVDASGREVKTVDNLQTFRERLRLNNKTISDVDLAKIIYRYIGESESVIENLPKDKLLEALSFVSCVQTTNYIKYSEDSGQTLLSKEEMVQELSFDGNLTKVGKLFLAENSTVQAGKKNMQMVQATSSIPQIETISSDGYMRLTTAAIETLGEHEDRTYYTITASAEWLKEPAFKLQDVLAITSNATYDNSYNDYGYFRETCVEYIGNTNGEAEIVNTYYEKNYLYKDGTTNKENSIWFEYSSGVGGVVLRFDMFDQSAPGSSTPHWFEFDISAYVRFRCSLYNVDGGVQAAYGHKKLGSNISVDLSSGAIGMSIIGLMDEYHGQTLSIYFQ